jgi:16S rRNA processing protein RimM
MAAQAGRPARASKKKKEGKTPPSSLLTADGTSLVPMAVVARPHGILGELKLKIFNSDSTLLLDLDGSKMILEMPKGERRPVTLTAARQDRGALFARLEGVGGREQAEALRGARLLVPRDLFPPAEEGEYYVCDLLGCRVVAPDGEVGVVEEVFPYPTCDALIVRPAQGALVEIPMIEGAVDSVDLGARVITLLTRDPLGLAVPHGPEEADDGPEEADEAGDAGDADDEKGASGA